MKNRSVVIGISAIQQKGDFENLDEALALMDQAVKEALSDSGNKLVKDHIDEIRIPKGFWRYSCLLYTSPSPRDKCRSRMPSSA